MIRDPVGPVMASSIHRCPGRLTGIYLKPPASNLRPPLAVTSAIVWLAVNAVMSLTMA